MAIGAFAWTAGRGRAADDAAPRIARIDIGFGGHYKVGYFTPVRIDVTGGKRATTVSIELILPDGDGVPSRVMGRPDQTVRVLPGKTTSSLLFAKFGRQDGYLTVRLLAHGKRIDQRTYRAAITTDANQMADGFESTDTVICTLGPPLGIPRAGGRRRFDGSPETHIISLTDIRQLPTRWYGYRGVDQLVLATSRVELFRGLTRGSARGQALIEWIERGGRLVMFVASEAAEVLAPASILADLSPARFDTMVALRRPRALETYCGTSVPVAMPGQSVVLDVPKMVDVRGVIAAHAGNRPTDLPLVIRAARGLGEVVLVLVEPDRPPLRSWKGRADFLKKVLGIGQTTQSEDDSGPVGAISTLGYTDLAGQLRDAMDRFRDVETVPFSVVAVLVLAYIVAIGPIDYLLVRKWLKRTELTWITFPLWVLLFSAGSYGLALWLKGDQLRLNQAELIDVDCDSGLVRGTVWSHLFSPRTTSYNVALAPRLPGATTAGPPRILLSWMGLPGHVLGAMGSSAATPSLFARPYSFSPQLDALRRVPVSVWSTKSLTACWTTQCESPIRGNLLDGIDHMLQGEITNNLEIDLGQCHLLYDKWVYTIPSLPSGRRQPIGDALAPQYIETWLARGAYSPWNMETPVPRIIDMIMFHRAVGGRAYTQLTNRYLHTCDLSELLKLGRAILVAWTGARGSQLLRDNAPLSSDRDRRWLVYRFVLPVERDPENE